MAWKEHFRMMADYNRWANAKVYDMAEDLSEEEFNRDMGAFFRSVCGTLNHILVADLIWMRRLTGEGEPPSRLDAILHPDLAGLRKAREAMDTRIAETIAGMDEADFAGTRTYTTIVSPDEVTTPVKDILTHIFNHQTHHRGQVHTIYTALGRPSLALDLIYYQREAA